jgi:hypothetical protein
MMSNISYDERCKNAISKNIYLKRVMATTLKSKALLFGLNYADDPRAALQGCINDVKYMASYLETNFKIPCELVTDDINKAGTTAQGIIKNLYQLATATHSESLDFVWIHYSGHGSWLPDNNGDEADGRDECLVPTDYKTAGLIRDDVLQVLFRLFNPKTRVVCIFDCCHSGSMGDVKYRWDSSTRVFIENIACRVNAKVLTISGCRDDQVAMDAFNVLGCGKYVGAMTACLLIALKERPALIKDAFALVSMIRRKLAERRFPQYPRLCSTHNLHRDRVVIPF